MNAFAGEICDWCVPLDDVICFMMRDDRALVFCSISLQDKQLAISVDQGFDVVGSKDVVVTSTFLNFSMQGWEVLTIWARVKKLCLDCDEGDLSALLLCSTQRHFLKY